MADRVPGLDRRQLMAGLGAALLVPDMPPLAAAPARPSLTLRAGTDVVGLRPGEPAAPIWSLQGQTPGRDPYFTRGDVLEIALGNELPVPMVLNWHGIDGVAAAEPLAAQEPLASGAKQALAIPLRHAGTFVCDLRLLGDGQRPAAARAVIVRENEPVAIDRDEVFLIEDWRLRPDGSAIAPGTDPKGTAPLYTVNRVLLPTFSAATHDRLRFRFINGCQRNVIAVRIEGSDLRVMALDGQPAEPFLARGGALVLAPGARIDAFIDANLPAGSTSPILLHDGTAAHAIAQLAASPESPARPAPLAEAAALPANGLPAPLDLKRALRIDVPLGGPRADWVIPANFATLAAPAFRARAGRTVVLALTNRTDLPQVFHLHGHHFRLLDRLDDGWKPFWLDTLAIDSGQTQRVAFLAEYAGRWLMETMAADWAAPRLVRWYSVE